MFQSKKVNMQTLGEYLLACRKRQELSLSEVAKLAQLQSKYLQALEEERYQDLPADVYVKGFLRSLARVYRIDQQELVDQFVTERSLSRQVSELDQPQSRSVLAPRLPRLVISPKTAMILGVAALGLLSLGYLYTQVRSLSAAPRLEIFSPAEDMTVSSSLLLVRGQTEPGASVFLNNQPIVADTSGAFLENLSLAPGTNQLVIKAQNKFGQETTVTRTVYYREQAVAGSFVAAPGSADELTLELVIGPQPAWIHVEADGREVYSGTMLPNSRRKIVAAEQIVLTTGNAGSTLVILDGKDLGLLGQEGEVLRDIEFTPTP